MVNLTRSNIKKSVDFFGESSSEDTQSILARRFTYAKSIDSLEGHYFGFYALRTILRAIFMSINYQIAGHHSLSKKYLAPSTVLFYTSAYHAIHGYQALHGRVLSDLNWRADTSDDRNPASKKSLRHRLVLGVLTKSNAWKFEPRYASHSSVWRELSQVFASSKFEVPKYFDDFFNFLYRGQFEGYENMADAVLEPDKYRYKLSDHIEEFLERISDLRHFAIYESTGVEPGLVDAMVDGSPYSIDAIPRQCEEFGLFSYRLLEDVTKQARAIVEEIRPNREVREALFVEVLLDHFDEPDIDAYGDRETAKDVRFLWNWLRMCEN